jgi:hypothetical protein
MLLLASVGCTDAKWAAQTALGTQFRITLYSGGSPVRQWISTGKVETEEHSDGWLFVDKATGGLVRVSGPVVVEQLSNP